MLSSLQNCPVGTVLGQLGNLPLRTGAAGLELSTRELQARDKHLPHACSLLPPGPAMLSPDGGPRSAFAPLASEATLPSRAVFLASPQRAPSNLSEEVFPTPGWARALSRTLSDPVFLLYDLSNLQ